MTISINRRTCLLSQTLVGFMLFASCSESGVIAPLSEPEIQVETQEGDLLPTDQTTPADEGLITDSMNSEDSVVPSETVESDGLSEVLEDVAFDADFDTGAPPEEGELGYPCDEADDCNSGYCVQSADGTVCSKTCEDSCPAGWSCKQLLSGGDAVYLCLPDFPTICMPCMENADCQLPGSDNDARCLPYADAGAFCGGACKNTPCPDGYTCQEVPDVLGQPVEQCVKDDGLCECSQLAISKSAKTSCAVTNEFGACTAERQCLEDGLTACDADPASAEICDGIDNDCNADTLDGAGDANYGAACDGDDADLCEGGTLACLEGSWKCSDSAEDALDVCDGLDNDCNPETEDGSADAEFGGACDSDDGDQCEDDLYACVDGLWSCQDVGSSSPDVCDGKDNDCNEATEDGSQDPMFNEACDGDDNDLCADGVFLCEGGVFVCTDSEATQPDLCDGLDNDCNPETTDGADEPTLGQACDGADTDLCTEGVTACVNGVMVCTDETDDNVDLCDGLDNDCNDASADGSGEVLLGTLCDGADADLCTDGAWVCQNGALFCEEDLAPVVELCDGLDNDCDPETADGSQDPGLGEICDGEDADLCAEGALACIDGTLACQEALEDILDVCDGEDNDCNPDTGDGMHDPMYGNPCDGTDTDLCAEGTWDCQAGKLSCIEVADDALDTCDGIDNDCNPDTEDGSSDAEYGSACDGDDADQCLDDVYACVAGKWECQDVDKPTPDVCDGIDNDCNEATLDGSQDPMFNKPCDGDDNDLCTEGVFVCEGGVLVCTDSEATQLELCDGVDNDCNPETLDGSDEPTLNEGCDGEDSDLCAEGVMVCLAGAMACNDETGDNPELCDGFDNDCNPASADGAHEELLGTACDGEDVDLCDDGAWVCLDGGLVCEEDQAPVLEICDGVDNDCNPETVDGSEDPSLNELCDGEDADLCQGGVLVCEGGSLGCNDALEDALDVCDGEDNDCDPNTADGVHDPTVSVSCDGADVDGCDDGSTVCQNGQVVCIDADDVLLELCDGVDNDCDAGTVDGTDDPDVGQPCDGEDLDLCDEGVTQCVNGDIVCSDPNTLNEELCDGVDNDCNPQTPDGLSEATLNQVCDGEDVDGCLEGTIVCTEGSLSCNDPNTFNAEICDGIDNDCNPETADGSGEATLNNPCDGNDADGCNEGTIVCEKGSLICNDPNTINEEVCDGIDNDCNPQTPDGLAESTLNEPCDGDDLDACKEGQIVCTNGSLSCSDPNTFNKESCDGVDNDCNPQTADGSGEATLNNACDGNDADACKEGKVVCTNGSLSCNDPNTFNKEVCDGIDNDCNPQTADGSAEATLNNACDGNDADLCIEGKIVCSGGSLICNDPNTNNKEVCDGLDNDCDNQIDEGFPNTDGVGYADCLDDDDDNDGVADNLDCQPLNPAVYPTCAGKQCGNDGCGGSCGGCSGQDACVNNQCVCQPNCNGKQCGSDGCGGSCGKCGGQDACVNNQCICQPNCGGKQCGGDGCGGSCGSCGPNKCINNQCKIMCTCNSPGPGGWAPGGNGFSCTDSSKNAYCTEKDDCTGYGEWEFGNFPCQVTCKCNSPGQGAPNNGFTCSDPSKNAYCGPSDSCNSGGFWIHGQFPCN